MASQRWLSTREEAERQERREARAEKERCLIDLLYAAFSSGIEVRPADLLEQFGILRHSPKYEAERLCGALRRIREKHCDRDLDTLRIKCRKDGTVWILPEGCEQPTKRKDAVDLYAYFHKEMSGMVRSRLEAAGIY